MFIREIVELISPVALTDTGESVFNRFNSNEDILSIAVVDQDHRPVGLIERNQLLLKFGRKYGYALFAGRPISAVLEGAPIVVEADTPAAEFMTSMLAERPSELLQGFVVVEDGRYLGVGTPLGLLRSTHATNRRHVKALEHALNAKTDLLAVMSHEIRTPLNGVLTIADVLHRKLEGDPLAPLVNTIVQSGDMLLQLLNDALDISRAEAGKLALNPIALSLPELVGYLRELWAPRAAVAGVELRFEHPEDDAWMLADAVRLKQVLNNLVSNALKFTPEGEVTVRFDTARRGDRIALHAEVHDTGLGVDPANMALVFQPFSQTEAGRAKGGAGLGLAVCKQLIEAMGGVVFATSQLGHGSVFGFDASFTATAAPAARPRPEAPVFHAAPVALRVLVADDNPTNRFVAQTVLTSVEAEVSAVGDGQAALSALAAQPFDVVLMDIKMPVMDGIEALQAIRASGAAWAGIPVIALTANAGRDDVKRYETIGFDAVIGKPFKPSALLLAIETILSRAQDLPVAEAAA